MKLGALAGLGDDDVWDPRPASPHPASDAIRVPGAESTSKGGTRLLMVLVLAAATGPWGCGSNNTTPGPATVSGAQSGADAASGSIGTSGLTGSTDASSGATPGSSGANGATGSSGTTGTNSGATGLNGGATGSSDAGTMDAGDSSIVDANSFASAVDGASAGMGDGAYTNPADSVVWLIDNLQTIGGHPTTLVLGAPMVIDTPSGKAVQFNGVGDALFVNTEPLAGFSTFTVEVIFRPDAGGAEAQRWFHMQAVGADRVLFEMRVSGTSWFLVSFVQSGTAIARPYAVAFPHPLGQWYHVAIVVDGASMKHYVNGAYENAGPCPMTEGCTPQDVQMLASPYPLAYKPIGTGTTSLGCRITEMAFLKGAIRVARFTPRALTPAEFMPLNY